MLLNLVKTFETPPGFDDFVGSRVRVRKTGTQNPVRLYTAEGIMLSNNGQVALGSDGLLDVWVAPGYLYDLDLLNPIGVTVSTVRYVNRSGGGLSALQLARLEDLVAASQSPSEPFDLTVGRYTGDDITIEVSWIISLTWDTTIIDWGDGSTTELGATSVPAHIYAEEGTYTITVTEREAGVPTGRVGTITFDTTTADDWGSSPYVAYGEASATNALEDVTVVQFWDRSFLLNEEAVSWLWDFGDGTTSTAQNPTHTYAAVGTYSVSLAVNGHAPVTLDRTVTVVTVPSAPAVTLRAQDTFTGDGAVKDRALTTPYTGVFDTWKATDTDTPLTSGGKLISAVPGSFGQFYSQQWTFGAPVTPPAAMQEFTVSLDFTPGVTSTVEQPYSYSSDWTLACVGTSSGTNDGNLFRVTVQASPGTDLWRFTCSVFGNDGDTRIVTKVIAQGSSVNLKFVMSDTEAYVLIGSTDIMVFSVAGRGTIGPLNSLNMQLGPPAGGSPAMDNYTVSSIN